MRIRYGIVLLLWVLASGCDSPQSSSPSAPSLPTQTPPPNSTLFGYVSDTAFRGVAGATVTVVDGSQAGQTTVTEANGRFSLIAPIENTPTLSISRDSYITARVASRRNGPSTFYASATLEAVAAPVNLVGNYTLTLTTDGSCVDIPSELRTRTYPVTIALDPVSSHPAGTALMLTAGGAAFLPGHDRFAIGVAGDTVGFSIYAGEDFALVEQVEPSAYLAISGFATVAAGTAPVSTISTAFGGTIDYCAHQVPSAWTYNCQGVRTAYTSCDARNHQLSLTRR